MVRTWLWEGEEIRGEGIEDRREGGFRMSGMGKGRWGSATAEYDGDLSAGNAVASMPCSRGEGEVSKEMDAEKAREMATCVTWWLETKLNDAGRGLCARTTRTQPCSCSA